LDTEAPVKSFLILSAMNFILLARAFTVGHNFYMMITTNRLPWSVKDDRTHNFHCYYQTPQTLRAGVAGVSEEDIYLVAWKVLVRSGLPSYKNHISFTILSSLPFYSIYGFIFLSGDTSCLFLTIISLNKTCPIRITCSSLSVLETFFSTGWTGAYWICVWPDEKVKPLVSQCRNIQQRITCDDI